MKLKIIILSAIVLAILVVVYFAFIRKSKETEGSTVVQPSATVGQTAASGGSSVSSVSSVSTASSPAVGIGYTPTTNIIGKAAYAKVSNTRVLNVSDGSTYKVASQGEWIGVISGTKTIGGSAFYLVAGGYRAVAQNLVQTN